MSAKQKTTTSQLPDFSKVPKPLMLRVRERQGRATSQRALLDAMIAVEDEIELEGKQGAKVVRDRLLLRAARRQLEVYLYS